MKKNLFIVALATLSLVSCSNDEVLDLQKNELNFSVVSNKVSRAADVYCNNNLPEDFKVWAKFSGTEYTGKWYISGDDVKKDGNVYVSEKNRYWPDGENVKLDFIAVKNVPCRFSMAGGLVVEGYSPAANVAEQLDVLYAVTRKQTKSANAAAGVNLNFRHALSQIVFNAKNTNKNIHVVVEGVRVGNVASSGTFGIEGVESTEVGYVNHDGDIDNKTIAELHWTASTIDGQDYQVVFTDGNEIELASDGNSVALTSANAEGKEFSNTAMLLVPQTKSAWDPTKGGAETTITEGVYQGAYLGVKCKIYNVAGSEYDSETDVMLHDGWALVPAEINWKAGMKYTYTFVFGEGNGGLTDDPTPIPVLASMSYTIAVDDFKSEANQDKEMDYPEE